MAGNTRGKLKEKLEGVHRNLDWCVKHLGEALGLIKEHKPELSESLKLLADTISELDELAMNIYAKL